MYRYNKDELKQSLTIDQVYEFVVDLGGEPLPIQNTFFVCRTICHNPIGEGSYKLYYYDNSKLFKCYTDCDEAFDIFELVCKVKKIAHEADWILSNAVDYVANYFGYKEQFFEVFKNNNLKDWSILHQYEQINKKSEKQIVQLKKFDKTILKYLPKPRIEVWEKEGIKKEVIKDYNIAYDPVNEGIVIPHYDKDNNLIGIRERTLIKDFEKYGKYLPAKINGIMYNHPLSFNLYNLNNSQDNIKIIQKAIIGEGEKFCLMYESFFGKENDITVACCGSSLIWYQVELLLSLGVREIIIAFDKQFKEIGDDEWKKWVKKLKTIHTKYDGYVQISFMFDKKDLLDYKDSPIDKGREVFLQLFKERIML